MEMEMGICNKCGGTGLIPPAWTVTYQAIAPTECARCNGKGAIDPALPLAKGWKKVMYFGHELIMPDWVNWISIDKGGHAYGYDWQPRQLDFEWRSLGDVEFLLSFNSSGFDWRETLREV